MEELLPFEKIKRKILVKRKATTSEEFGCFPEERAIAELINYGVININKPSGPSSHQVADYVKKIVGIGKVGHGGTLDPKVTGVLPIALGKATRIAQTLLKTGKEYVCLMYLHSSIPESKIKNIFKEFIGKIEQIPPVRSAVKREKRAREIYYIKILEIDGKHILFKVGCEAGTYIRKLVNDIGLKLGTRAHMTELVRTKVGAFNDNNWITLHDLKDAYVLYKGGDEKELKKIVKPIEFAIQHLPQIWVLDTTVDSLCHGAFLSTPGISKLHDCIKENDLVAVLTLKNELVCLGQAKLSSKEIIEKEKGVAVRTSKVFMERGIYPKFKKN